MRNRADRCQGWGLSINSPNRILPKNEEIGTTKPKVRDIQKEDSKEPHVWLKGKVFVKRQNKS